MQQDPFFLLIGVGQLIMRALPPLILFVFAIVNYSRCPRACQLVLVGCVLHVITVVGLLGIQHTAASQLAAADMARFAIWSGLVGSILHGVSLFLIGIAAFTDRESSRVEVAKNHVAAPSGPSPFQSGV